MLAMFPPATEAVLGSPLKVRTLRVLRRYPTREFTTRELAREVGASDVGVGKALDDLEVGVAVQFIEEPAAEGMQAKRVSVGHHHLPE